LNWEHHITPLSEDIKVFATIFPQVGTLFILDLMGFQHADY